MSFVSGLKCLQCGKTYAKTEFNYTCGKCGGFLDVKYDYEALANALNLEELERRSHLILKKWLEFLPIEQPALIDRVTLGEYETPLLKYDKISDKLGLSNIYIKNDTYFPTCSLKDRSMPLMVLKALEFGFDTVSIVSSGNAASSLSAYAAKAGLKAVVFVSGNPSVEQLAKIAAYGPRLIWVNGSYNEVERLFIEAREEFKWFDCNGLVNPYRVDGKKTYAHEIASQLGWKAPDVFVITVAFGNGIVATWKGFKELHQLGLIKSLPRLIAVQPEACEPIAKAFREGKADVKPVTCAKTVAANIAIGNPDFGGKRVLEAVRESRGTVVSVSENAIIDACKTLGRDAGLFVEPAGALSIAGLMKLVQTKKIDREEVVIPVVTGHGANNPRFAVNTYKIPKAIEPKLGEIRKSVCQSRL